MKTKHKRIALKDVLKKELKNKEFRNIHAIVRLNRIITALNLNISGLIQDIQ